MSRTETKQAVGVSAAGSHRLAATLGLLLLTWTMLPSTVEARRALPKLDIDVEGYYWTRFVYLSDLASFDQHLLPSTQSTLREPITDTRYLTHHVRLEPRVSLGRLARLNTRIDALQDVVWGDNDARSPSPLFEARPTETDFLGRRVPSIKLTAIYLDLKLRVGNVKVGRMPFQWGMGLLYNSGGNLIRNRAGVDDDFGDNHFPTIYDRIMLSAEVLELVDLLRGKEKQSGNHSLIAAYSYDRLVEEPFDPGIPTAHQRPLGDQTFLSRQANNVDQHGAALFYRWYRFADGVSSLKSYGPSELVLGVYGAYRRQRRLSGIVRVWDAETMGFAAHDCSSPMELAQCGTDSDLYILDPYMKVKLGRLITVESEGYLITGSTEPFAAPLGEQVTRVRTYGWAMRVTSKVLRWLNFKLDAGQASGDGSNSDGVYRQRPMHPDHNVGLIMYEEFLRQRSAMAPVAFPSSYPAGRPRTWSTTGAWSKGGVINSYYVMPTLQANFVEFFAMRLAVLNAWSHKQDGYLFPEGRGRHIGTEVDIAMDLRWAKGEDTLKHLLLRLEGGYLLFGSQVRDDYDARGAFTLQARLAFVL